MSPRTRRWWRRTRSGTERKPSWSPAGNTHPPDHRDRDSVVKLSLDLCMTALTLSKSQTWCVQSPCYDWLCMAQEVELGLYCFTRIKKTPLDVCSQHLQALIIWYWLHLNLFPLHMSGGVVGLSFRSNPVHNKLSEAKFRVSNVKLVPYLGRFVFVVSLPGPALSPPTNWRPVGSSGDARTQTRVTTPRATCPASTRRCRCCCPTDSSASSWSPDKGRGTTTSWVSSFIEVWS